MATEDYFDKRYDMCGREISEEQWRVRYLDIENRRLAVNQLPGGLAVSTVLLRHDHSYTPGVGLPVIFETHVFGTGDVQWYSTWTEAMEGHRAMCAAIRARGDAS